MLSLLHGLHQVYDPFNFECFKGKGKSKVMGLVKLKTFETRDFYFLKDIKIMTHFNSLSTFVCLKRENKLDD